MSSKRVSGYNAITEEERYMNPICPQPYIGGTGTSYDGTYEYVDYLPGTNVRIWYTSKQDCFAVHYHQPLEIVQCEHGYYISTIQGVEYKICPGDILLIPSKMVHTLFPMNDCRGYVHLLDPSVINDIRSTALIKDVLSRPVLIKADDKPELAENIGSLLYMMHDAYFGSNALRELIVYSYLLQILDKVGNSLMGDSLPDKTDYCNCAKELVKYNKVLNEVCDYISSSYDEHLSLEEVSEKFGFSTCYFSRIFKEYTKTGFKEYVNACRIKHSKEYLTKTELSINDISAKVGFETVQSFNRVFLKKTGNTPSGYRKLYKMKTL
ncbi:MAG: AraC family transcriptional regulator [Butyrivibrio sp.]|uniref:AraC family transcriptional regulator n=1 Tax=Butyrivibrio sp. TaxID=28121 RepID=UPI0025E52FDC|nr:AraC family transcriptional regulator [Butyrivibrio sp.]MCR5773229.1 AraC family transcriptional regulator [Butyrivibrio sp.]